MKETRRLALILAVAGLLSWWGCQRAESPVATGPTIALVLKTLNNPFFIEMERGAQQGALPLGVTTDTPRSAALQAMRDFKSAPQQSTIDQLLGRTINSFQGGGMRPEPRWSE